MVRMLYWSSPTLCSFFEFRDADSLSRLNCSWRLTTRRSYFWRALRSVECRQLAFCCGQ
jgi:hypothetical protein